ncbi:hypothetical protein [Comamonas sp. BIGb0124]|uniref:hypothetical protein n=1 Tax=Comamonas sp. BIGb0124 TaxID=2485130 RepID=UPI0011CE8EA1|nr:hypothetical protein [Comamonas sp. BIGb0124]
MNRLIIVGLSALLASCAQPPRSAYTPEVYQISAPFDAEATRSQLETGTATVSGTAFLRQNGGGVVTCAGSPVHLFPATPYAKERIEKTYIGGPSISTPRYVQSFGNSNDYTVYPDPPEFARLKKSTLCDAQGNFEFKNLKPGLYYLATKVEWHVTTVQGGELLALVDVQSNDQPRLILTRP